MRLDWSKMTDEQKIWFLQNETKFAPPGDLTIEDMVEIVRFACDLVTKMQAEIDALKQELKEWEDMTPEDLGELLAGM